MKIGIFDSGIGGLKYLKAIRKKLPNFDYVYFGDVNNLPYGDKTQKEILELTKSGIEFLFKKNCKIVILACNSSSSEALRSIQQVWLPKYYPTKKVLGVLVPIAEEVAENKKIKKVGVIGTNATIAIKAYDRELKKINNKLKIIDIATPALVPLIEKKANNEEVNKALKHYLAPMKKNNIDALILGCTHYSWIYKLIEKQLPKVIIPLPEKIVANKFVVYINKHTEIKKCISSNGKEDIFFSKTPMSRLFFDQKKIGIDPNILTITIAGLGIIGRGVDTALFLAKKGINLVVTDLKNKKDLHSSLQKLKNFKNVKYVLGKHRKQDFVNTDMVIQNPNVPQDSIYIKATRNANVPIETDLTIFWKILKQENSNVTIVGITGSKGKSTTTALIYNILKHKFGKKVFLGGNLAESPLNFVYKIKSGDIVVLELSSWDLENLSEYSVSPNIAVITNILRDHLNRYNNSINNYEQAKKNIIKYQSKNDFVVLNSKDSRLKKWSKSVAGKIKFFDNSNKNAAIEVAKIFKIKKQEYEKVIKKFKGLPHRQEFVKKIQGVSFYNDSAATMPDASIKAINDLSPKLGKLFLILGGVDKNLDYKLLANKIIIKHNLRVLLLPGTASDKLELFFKKSRFKFDKVKNLKQAVSISKKEAKKGDIVVLSPGAASFNLFKNEFDRGEQFAKITRA